MKKKDRSDKLYLEDLLTAMNRIAEYIEGYNFDQFKQDYRTVDAIVRNFEIIGEASKNVSEVIKNQIFYWIKITEFHFTLNIVIQSCSHAINHLPDRTTERSDQTA